ncbi:XdhC family protein [uncultured Aliiroseovarius sp.]|uniref:XdhC family protein n=1 Tax=uncultured Aliiroseovarius sp. TaxID=1658783 RepID=UPI002591C9B7|nr:XdhC family protein [uncultured Aliiroseovarius sp.]
MASSTFGPETALAWHCAGRRVALATVVQTWGSAPNPMGSQMVIAGDGGIAGSVSGGCVEGAVVSEAMDVLDTATPRLLRFGVTDGDAFAAGLACGGTIRVLVEPVVEAHESNLGLSAAMLSELVACRAARVPVAYQVHLGNWTRRLLTQDSHPEAIADAATGLADDWFTALDLPAPRLFLVGAVHIAQVLAPMAQAAGFDPVVIDPRPSFATPDRFPMCKVICDDSDDALDALGVDARTAIVTLGHNPRIDDPAIERGLAAGAIYVGCLGSRRTHAARLERLRAAGVTDTELARLHGPVGLDIGAEGPAEIAVSILSELIAVRRGKTLRDSRR